ncbi:hypothetical protein M075_3058 [Bacteroides fragilis str. 20793-3]|nr:hypothetical protein M075_3058 [Bacteroides fragilis str. 20793-3]
MAAGTGILWMIRQHKFAPQISQIITDEEFIFSATDFHI